jgi:hypothetical protein
MVRSGFDEIRAFFSKMCSGFIGASIKRTFVKSHIVVTLVLGQNAGESLYCKVASKSNELFGSKKYHPSDL